MGQWNQTSYNFLLCMYLFCQLIGFSKCSWTDNDKQNKIHSGYYNFSGQDTLIMMTREFDPVTEKPLHPDNFGAGK